MFFRRSNRKQEGQGNRRRRRHSGSWRGVERGRLIKGDIARNADAASNRVIAAVTLMLKTVTEEDRGSRLSSEFSPLAGGKKDKIATTKDAEMIIARGRAM